MTGMEMPGVLVSSMKTMPGMTDVEMCEMEMSPGMDMATSPCDGRHPSEVATEDLSDLAMCCVTIPQEPGSTGTTFNLRSPSFSIAVTSHAVMQPPVLVPKPGTRPYVTQFFVPNLQASYIRNLSFLI
jgi:hypothetical protein